jgi:hypothetical protein
MYLVLSVWPVGRLYTYFINCYNYNLLLTNGSEALSGKRVYMECTQLYDIIRYYKIL